MRTKRGGEAKGAFRKRGSAKAAPRRPKPVEILLVDLMAVDEGDGDPEVVQLDRGDQLLLCLGPESVRRVPETALPQHAERGKLDDETVWVDLGLKHPPLNESQFERVRRCWDILEPGSETAFEWADECRRKDDPQKAVGDIEYLVELCREFEKTEDAARAAAVRLMLSKLPAYHNAWRAWVDFGQDDHIYCGDCDTVFETWADSACPVCGTDHEGAVSLLDGDERRELVERYFRARFGAEFAQTH